jgi:polysaccharide export outer membrane protein
MYSQRRSFSSRAIVLLALLVLVGMLVLAAPGQTTNPDAAGAAKPVLPADSNEGKAAPPAATDTPATRVSEVNPKSYVIGTEDILTVNVWKEPEISKMVPVRPDGMISLPLVGEIQATGLTPIQLQDQITTSLKKLMADPQVTVIVSEVHSLTFNVVGQVQRPGYYPLTRRMTVLDAIAMAGGFRDFAKEKKVYVLRTSPDGKQVRLAFNYKNIIKGKHNEQNIELQPRDTLVVP